MSNYINRKINVLEIYGTGGLNLTGPTSQLYHGGTGTFSMISKTGKILLKSTENVSSDAIKLQSVNGGIEFHSGGSNISAININGIELATGNYITSNTGGIVFRAADSGHAINLLPPDNGPTSGEITFKLPSNTGSNGQFLKTDGSGALSWDTASGSSSNVSARTIINTATYTIKSTDVLVSILYTTTGAVTLTLPTASVLAEFSIVDEAGNASSNNITINRVGSDTIIGNTSLILNGDYNAVRLYSNGGTAWFIM